MVKYIGSANDPLAQSVEHLTFNQGVRSSSLRWVTKKCHTPLGVWHFLFPTNTRKLSPSKDGGRVQQLFKKKKLLPSEQSER